MSDTGNLADDLALISSWCARGGAERMNVRELAGLYDALVAMGRIKREVTSVDHLADVLDEAQRRADGLYACRARRDRRMVTR
jgi:hypothetical protein